MKNQETGDGKFVAVQNGKRVSPLKDTQQEALEEAKKQTEDKTPDQPVQVKRHICG